VNHPYPTALQLRAEAAIGTLLAEQAASTASFRTIIEAARTSINALSFPIGSPAHGYDLLDITGALDDWLVARDPEQLEQAAEDLVLERIAS
jgi:hypothetical protein